MPESGRRRGAAGPTSGATVSRSSRSGVVAMPTSVPPDRRRTAPAGRWGPPPRTDTVGALVVRVRLLAVLGHRAGRDALELELPDGARVSDALAAVEDLAAGLPLVLAVNREYAG